MRNTKLWINVLWVLVVVLAVARLATTAFSPSLTIPVVLAAAVFALIHGALRYRWSGVLVFLVICLVVSNILENTSILSAFPFGHYHYTSGPKLFLVPLHIGPSYFATAYLAWMLAIVLIGDVRHAGSWFTTVGVPVIASAVMVSDRNRPDRPRRSGFDGCPGPPCAESVAAEAEQLMLRAHERCPYSRAIRGNVEVRLTIDGQPLERSAA